MIEDITIDIIRPERDLESVIQLGDANRATLGFLPRAVFKKYAHDRTILVALDKHNSCIGYLLYRITNNVVIITHLCVSSSLRNHNVGYKLLSALIDIERDKRGIKLKCRDDAQYASAKHLWRKAHFDIIDYCRGRGKNDTLLAIWWRNLNDINLFSSVNSNITDSTLCAVIDVNILIDLMSPVSPKTIPSKSLLSDWLTGNLELCVTGETFNEINKQEDKSIKLRRHNYANSFRCLECDTDEYARILNDSKDLFPALLNNPYSSDHKQISRAIAAGAHFFITRDKQLLGKSNEISTRFGIQILTPSEIILRLDELSRSYDYQPVHFEESELNCRLIKEDDINVILSTLANTEQEERKRDLLSILNLYLSNPSRYENYIINDECKIPQAIYIIDKEEYDKSTLSVPLIRVNPKPLVSTLARKLINHLLKYAYRKRLEIISILDKDIQMESRQALSYYRFIPHNGNWIKINMYGCFNTKTVKKRLRAVTQRIGISDNDTREWIRLLNRNNTTVSISNAAEQERLLWPLKFADVNIPSYIVPIRYQWANELFDENLSRETLFRRKTSLALNVEGIYYSARINKKIQAPLRVIWYISRRKGRPDQTMRIRACSTVIDIDIDKPNDLFKRYKNLGVYEWRHLLEMVRGDRKKRLMALRFTDTELLENPIPWPRIQEILRSAGIHTMLRSAVEITQEAYNLLYTEGTGFNLEK